MADGGACGSDVHGKLVKGEAAGAIEWHQRLGTSLKQRGNSLLLVRAGCSMKRLV